MKLTYEDIVSQVARKLGYSGFDSSLKSDLRLAIRFAEEQLYIKSNLNKREETFSVVPDKERYELPVDFNEPCQFIFKDTSGNKLEAINVPFETLLKSKIPANDQTNEVLSSDEIRISGNEINDIQEDQMFRDKIIYSVHFTDGFYQLGVKPPFTGTCTMYYGAIPIDDVFANLKRTPALPEHFHPFVIYGATAYMAETESAKKFREKDFDTANFYRKLGQEMQSKFDGQTDEVRASATKQAEPGTIRSFMWYDNPRKYRSRR